LNGVQVELIVGYGEFCRPARHGTPFGLSAVENSIENNPLSDRNIACTF
jgi:hypothetical protein